MNAEISKLIIIGASGHGKVIADIAARCGYTDIAFFDDNPEIKECMGYPVIGKTKNAKEYPNAKFIVAIGNPKIRQKVQEQLEAMELSVISLIHPKAVVADHVEIGKGTVVMAGVIINPACRIGKGCIVNTGASVDHDNVLEDFVHVSVGSHLAGTVQIGKRTWIGAGAVVSNNIKICEDCMIGAGAVVVKDIEKSGIYVGVPVREQVRRDTENMSKQKNEGGGVILLFKKENWKESLDYQKQNRRVAA